MELHLDPVGGVAGDMFIAALLDVFPALEAGVIDSIGRALPGEVECRLLRHRDHVLQGARFAVEAVRHRHGHEHTSWAAIRTRLQESDLAAEVKRNALGIFALLAEAEGRVHGIDAEAVGFHEVGALDSIADIVGAAHIAAMLGEARWSVGPVPLGSGRVQTAHGLLPIPAPATALLLEGFSVLDDGIGGERVTPTGAAILRWLVGTGARARQKLTLGRSGFGFGTRSLPGVSNCLRVLVLDAAVESAGHREIAVVEFEVDDQSAEDLALGLDRLRGLPEIFDVLQIPAFGKKGRMMTHIQVLAQGTALDAVVAACFRETTTIGLRHRVVHGTALPRRIEEVEIAGHALRVKTAERPGGRTAKAEIDDVAALDGHDRRSRLRHTAERQALAAAGPDAAAEIAVIAAETSR